MLIDPGHRAAIQKFQELAMPCTGVVQRTGATTKCNVLNSGGSDRIREMPRIEALRRWEIQVPNGTDVTAGDVMIITDIESGTPVGMGRYIIVVDDQQRNWQTVAKLYAVLTHRADPNNPYGFGVFNIPTNAVVDIQRPTNRGGAIIHNLPISLMPASEVMPLDPQTGMTQFNWVGVMDALTRYPSPDNGVPQQGDILKSPLLKRGQTILQRVERSLEPLDRLIFYLVDSQ